MDARVGCPSCGASVSPDVVRCHRCQAPIAVNPTIGSSASATSSAVDPGHRALLLASCLAAAFAVLDGVVRRGSVVRMMPVLLALFARIAQAANQHQQIMRRRGTQQ